jgi:hypothetical protein
MSVESKKSEHIHQRIDPGLKERFKRAAVRDNRTMANALVVAIHDYILKIMGKSK